MKIVFATNNPNKVKEVQSLLPATIEIISLKDIGCVEEVPETAETIAGNAIQKAKYVSEKYNVACFADDTGLEVNALNGAPGVKTARYAGEEKSADKNMQKLLKALENKEDRTAQFKTVIALEGFKIGSPQESTLQFEGICKGEITTELRGKKGFGYDPIFQPEGFDETFAELPMAIKNKISHRGRAMQQLIAFLEKQ